MKKLIGFILCACLGAALLAGCAPAQNSATIIGGRVTGADLNKTEAGEYRIFEVAVEMPGRVDSQPAGQPLGLAVHGSASQGSLHAMLLAPGGETAWDSGPLSGNYAINTTFIPQKAGLYQLGVRWDGPVKATYNLYWQPGPIETAKVQPPALFGGAGMLVVALGFIVYALVRKLGLSYLLLGAAAWIVTVALKFAWAIPMNGPISQALLRLLPEGIANLLIYVYVGALTGVFEVGLTYLLLRFTPLGKVTWSKALAFGIGFGALEALLLGLSSLATMLAGIYAAQSLPLNVIETLAQQNSLLYGAAPVVERFFTVLIHIFSNVLIFYAVVARKPGAFWLAFVYKTALDTVAAYGQIVGIDSLARLWSIEAGVILFGLLGWIGTRRVAALYPIMEAPAEALIETAGAG